MIEDRLTHILDNCELGRLTDYPGVLYFRLYKDFPCVFRFYFDNNGEIKIHDGTHSFTNIDKNIKKEIDTRYFIQKIREYKHIINVLPINNDEFICIGKDMTHLLIHVITTSDEHDSDRYIEVYCKDMKYAETVLGMIKDCFKVSDRKTEYEFGIATFNGNYIGTQYYDYEPKEVDIELNYNDDFKKPYEKVCDVIERKNETGLILFYGEPGTGKSSVIKNLISKYPETEFVFVDGSLLCHASQNNLVSYFVENQNTVFILEDCEKVLLSREEGFNPVINTLLNITDGIIGDVLGIKLICTFNTSLNKIDKALLRKGRLSLKYEFKKLKKDKVSKILGREVKEDMTLADIYNIDDENDFSKEEKRKSGFNV